MRVEPNTANHPDQARTRLEGLMNSYSGTNNYHRVSLADWFLATDPVHGLLAWHVAFLPRVGRARVGR